MCRASAAWFASPPDADIASWICTGIASGHISSNKEEAMLVVDWDLH